MAKLFRRAAENEYKPRRSYCRYATTYTAFLFASRGIAWRSPRRLFRPVKQTVTEVSPRVVCRLHAPALRILGEARREGPE